MNRYLWSCAALLTLFVTVESLSCYTCDEGILGYCLVQEAVNCTKTQDKCYVAVAKFSSDLLDIHERGCTNSSGCDNSRGSILNVNYTISRTCCNSTLCNTAAGPELPLTAALAASLLAVWSQWGL
ncbi:urokinase plasminogen activator surface receptor-like [Cottoperca gobio]|uniref:Urokinase plasminogen activator surface receptor-like n=1 Tax=Cottoperca gobio TaxID=56716 RepID=A0A6J2QLW6_COTGO|nr:urokinase plasminogen activator surface receptor-like [Cottoperca gobio]